ncbi:hypothetical protein [Bacillus sp. B1-b2]|nr:hypothetical protein [Bacillus sp. B1-b2]
MEKEIVHFLQEVAISFFIMLKKEVSNLHAGTKKRDYFKGN